MIASRRWFAPFMHVGPDIGCDGAKLASPWRELPHDRWKTQASEHDCWALNFTKPLVAPDSEENSPGWRSTDKLNVVYPDLGLPWLARMR